jgi:hypothetical protein
VLILEGFLAMQIRPKHDLPWIMMAIAVPLIPCLAFLTASQPATATLSGHGQGTRLSSQSQPTPLKFPLRECIPHRFVREPD